MFRTHLGLNLSFLYYLKYFCFNVKSNIIMKCA